MLVVGMSIMMWWFVAVLWQLAVVTARVRNPETELRLNRGVTYTRTNSIINSADLVVAGQLLLAIAIMTTILLAIPIFRKIKQLCHRHSFISFLPTRSALSTIVVSLSSESDGVVLPMITPPMPPSVFSLKRANPRSLQIQNQCLSSRLMVDWGSANSIHFHDELPITLPTMISVPLTHSRRVFNIINRPHITKVLIYYEDVIYFIKEDKPETTASRLVIKSNTTKY